MVAFDRILREISDIDTALDKIRFGDNVVWRVSELSESRLFIKPYLRKSITDWSNMIYLKTIS